MTVWDVTPVEDHERVPVLLSRFLAAGIMSGDYSLLCKDGSTREVEYRAVANILPGLHLAVHRDITERKRAEEALRESAGRLQVLSRRVVEVQEEERRHLARELHDEIGQSLTAIGINLQALLRSCSAVMLPHLEECISIVDHSIEQVRHLSLDLRPAMLDDLGLVATLRWYLDRQAQRVGYQARFAADADEIRLSSEVATAAFRVAQEALTNVARHAYAQKVRVTVRFRDGGLRLIVRDDGAGFDPEVILRRGVRGEGVGLLGMRERASLLGGRVVIRSAIGRGTEIWLMVPVAQPGEEASHGSDPRPDRR